jgi:hypothetical protein
MNEMDALYPGYGLCKHKGYWTAEHITCINKLGPAHPPPHFQPIKECICLEAFAQRSRQLGETLAANSSKTTDDYYRNQLPLPYGEIDIIAQEADCIVFSEVRTKTGNLFGPPEESVSENKETPDRHCLYLSW